MYRRKNVDHPVVLTQHVLDKIRSIDMTLAEFEVLLGTGEVIEEVAEGELLKELVLLTDWTRPLHVVILVDDVRGEERVKTVYEPRAGEWTDDFRRRRR